MTRTKINSWLREIERRQNAIAKERDRLDAAISEMEELKDSCERAYEDMQNARDALSELV